MKRFVKPVLISLAALAAVVAAAVLIYAKMTLTPEVIKATLGAAVHEQLRRELSFGSLELDIFSGVTIKDAIILKSYAWETEDFFTCDEIDLGFGFWPLLFKKLVIRSLTIKNPRISLHAAAGRSFSLEGTARRPAGAAPELELLVLPGSVMVTGGAITWTDPQTSSRFGLQNLRIDAGSISYILPFDVSAQASLDEHEAADIKLTGHCFVPSQEYSAELSVPELDLVRFQGLFASLGIPVQRGQVALSVSAKAAGEKPVELSGKLALKGGEVVLLSPQKGDDDISLSNLGAELKLQAEYDPITGNAALKKVQGALLSAPLDGSGSLRGQDGQETLELHVAADRFSLDELSERLNYGAASPFKGLRLTGLLGLRLDMSSRPGSGAPFPTITINLHANHIVYPALGTVQPELNGTLTFDSKAITLSNLRFGTRNMGLVLAGTLANYFSWPPEADVRVVSSDFNFYELFSAPEKEQGEDIGPFDFGALKFEGPIDLGNASFLALDLTDVQGFYQFEKNRFSIRDFKGGIKQGGSFNLGLAIDVGVKGFGYGLNLALADVPVQQVGELAGADLSQFMDGIVNGSINVSARGTKSTTFSDSLGGSANFRIRDCRIRGFAMPEQVSRFVKTEEFSMLSFPDSYVQLKLHQGAVEVSGSFRGPKAELYPSGQINLNTQLDMQAQLKLSNEVFAADTKVAQYLPREGSWVSLPVVIKGTVDNPVVTLTDDAIRYILQETLPRLFMDMLEKSRSQQGSAESEE